jgi:hypothetical protein
MDEAATGIIEVAVITVIVNIKLNNLVNITLTGTANVFNVVTLIIYHVIILTKTESCLQINNKRYVIIHNVKPRR